jgi:hypothetical protein
VARLKKLGTTAKNFQKIVKTERSQWYNIGVEWTLEKLKEKSFLRRELDESA